MSTLSDLLKPLTAKPTGLRKPHPDVVLFHPGTGTASPWPTSDRHRDVGQDVADARFIGYVLAVPYVKTQSGRLAFCIIEGQCGGAEKISRLLRLERTPPKGWPEGESCPTNLLVADFEKLSAAKKELLLGKPAAKVDPKDVRIAELEAKLADAAKLAAASVAKGAK